MTRRPNKNEPIALTEELVALVDRIEPDPGLEQGMQEPTDEYYSSLVTSLLEQNSPDELWVFAYGSLIWNPGFEVEKAIPALAVGWHRSYCITLTRCRGTPLCPSLMLAIDRGGSCRGVALRLPAKDRFSQLRTLMQREIDALPATYIPRWITIQTEDGPRPALTFVVDTKGPAYAGKLPLDHVARTLAISAGHLGSSAVYLHKTVSHIDAHGIRDRNLWEIQRRVAKEIRGFNHD
jgi:cation transport protein ChaC